MRRLGRREPRSDHLGHGALHVLERPEHARLVESAHPAFRRATRTTLTPLAAAWRANSSPIPEDAPVTSAQGPYACLSICFITPFSGRNSTTGPYQKTGRLSTVWRFSSARTGLQEGR